MSIPQILSDQLTTYYPAALHSNKCWYVNYYVFNPYTQEMEEKRIKVNRIKSIPERRNYARKLIKEINSKLESGWNPLIKHENVKQFHRLLDVIEIYKRAKYKELEDNSIRSYDSFLLKLSQHIETIDIDLYCGAFNKRFAADFMLHIKADENICNRTYNNHLLFYRRYFKWMHDFDYISDNPFDAIPPISKKFIKKKRRALTREQLRQLVEFLEPSHPRFLVASMLLYYCLLRPDDLAYLKKKHFNLNNYTIQILADETKNDSTSFRVIPKVMEKYIETLNLDRMHPNDFIFSDHKSYSFTAGEKKIDSRYFAKYWAERVRPALGFNMELQFYSLKDTGITNLMADGISPAYIQGQADHSSLEITNMYLDKRLPEGYEQIRNLAKAV